MRTRYFIGLCGVVYIVAVIYAVVADAVLGNQIAMVDSVVMMPLMIHGARHHGKRHPESKRDLVRWSYIMFGWLCFAVVIHGLGAQSSTSPAAYAVMPSLAFMAMVMSIVSLEIGA